MYGTAAVKRPTRNVEFAKSKRHSCSEQNKTAIETKREKWWKEKRGKGDEEKKKKMRKK